MTVSQCARCAVAFALSLAVCRKTSDRYSFSERQDSSSSVPFPLHELTTNGLNVTNHSRTRCPTSNLARGMCQASTACRHYTFTIDNLRRVGILFATNANKAQVRNIAFVDNHLERVPLRSSCSVWYGSWSQVRLSYPEARAFLLFDGLAAAQNIFRLATSHFTDGASSRVSKVLGMIPT